MYTLSKLFSAVSYSSRNKYLSNNDKIYSTVVQETQAELALTEVAETTLQETSTKSRTKQRKRSGLLSGTGAPLQKIRLYLFENLLVKTENQTKKIILLVLFSQEIVSKYKKKSMPPLMKKRKRPTTRPKPSKLVLATMQLVLFFERKKSPEHSFQEANFNKKYQILQTICMWSKINI